MSSHVRRSSLALCSLIALASGVGALGAGSAGIPQQPATVEHALGLIASGDYKSARSELTALAEIGAFRADYYLGLMMQSGQGGVADPAAALGYYESATELGGSEPVEAPGLRSRLPAAPRPADDAVVARFGRDAVARRLSERVLAAAMVPVDPEQRPPLWLTGPRLERFYPRSAARHEEQAFILLSVLVDTDGRAKDPLIEEALAGESRSDFENGAIDAILSAQFRPARRAGAAIATRRAMRIYFAVAGRNLWNERALRELKRKADGGDVRSQATVAYMAMVTTGWRPAFNLPPDKRARAGVMAALNGSVQMQLWLSVELARSAGSNDVGASHWRREAARHGSGRAQLLMGRQALESSVSGAVLEARTWLAHAAESDDPYVMKHVAWLMATAPEDSVRDPETALRLAERLDATRSINPELSLVLAAALAANGRLVEARDAAAAAVKKAEKLGWDTSALHTDLQQYVDGRSPAPRELVASAEELNLLRDGAM